MVPTVGVSEVVGCRIWDVLEFIEKLIVPYVVAVAKAGCNKGMDQDFGRSSEEQERQVGFLFFVFFF